MVTSIPQRIEDGFLEAIERMVGGFCAADASSSHCSMPVAQAWKGEALTETLLQLSVLQRPGFAGWPGSHGMRDISEPGWLMEKFWRMYRLHRNT